MEKSFWEERWAQDRIGFHRDDVHPLLLDAPTGFLETPRRVLIPLCGMSHDLKYLCDAGHDVVGVEIVAAAVERFFDEHALSPEVTVQGPFRVFSTPGLTVYCGDIFDFGAEVAGRFERIWDRAALIALDAVRRRRYAECLRRLIEPNGSLLLSTVEYDQSVMDGPPWSVGTDEVTALYPTATIQRLYRQETIDASRWKERGHSTWVEGAHLITVE